MQSLFTQPATAPAAPLPTRRDLPRENVSASFVLALTLHAALIGTGIAWAFLAHSDPHSWGENSHTSGSIEASMVSSIPLPSKQNYDPNKVLTTDSPSKAVAAPKPKAEPPPKPNEVLIPEKTQPKPTKIAEKSTPEPPKHLEPPTPTTKAPTGESTGVRLPMAQQQVKNGTASITVDDRSFGDRYAYYTRIVDQKVSQSWNSQDLPTASTGMRTIVVFTINPDGSPSDVKILTRSGSLSFDTTALRAIQRIDTFGPLPQNKAITVEFALDYKQQ